MDAECENCIYYENEVCIRKDGIRTLAVCVHYVNRRRTRSAERVLDELIDAMVNSKGNDI